MSNAIVSFRLRLVAFERTRLTYETIIAILAMLLIASTPAVQPKLHIGASTVAPRITLSSRCQQLQITNRYQLLEGTTARAVILQPIQQ